MKYWDRLCVVCRWLLAAVLLAVLYSGSGESLSVALHTNIALRNLLRVAGARWPNPAYALSAPSSDENDSGRAPAVESADHVALSAPTGIAPFARAQYLNWLGETQQAQIAWQELLSNGQRTELAGLALGLLAIKKGDIELAARLWGDLDAPIIDYLINQGDYLLRSEEYEEALVYYRLAERLQSDDLALTLRIIMGEIYLQDRKAYFAHLDSVLAYWGLERTLETITYLQALVSDGFVWEFIAAADVYQQRQDDLSAEKVLRMAVQVYPGPVTYVHLGSFYCNRGRYSEGIAVLEQAKPYGDQYYALQSRQRLSICFCQAGMPERAIAEAQDLARMAPDGTPFQAWDVKLTENWTQLCEVR